MITDTAKEKGAQWITQAVNHIRLWLSLHRFLPNLEWGQRSFRAPVGPFLGYSPFKSLIICLLGSFPKQSIGPLPPEWTSLKPLT